MLEWPCTATLPARGHPQTVATRTLRVAVATGFWLRGHVCKFAGVAIRWPPIRVATVFRGPSGHTVKAADGHVATPRGHSAWPHRNGRVATRAGSPVATCLGARAWSVAARWISHMVLTFVRRTGLPGLG